MVLSLFLVIWWNLSSCVRASYDLISSVIIQYTSLSSVPVSFYSSASGISSVEVPVPFASSGIVVPDNADMMLIHLEYFVDYVSSGGDGNHSGFRLHGSFLGYSCESSLVAGRVAYLNLYVPVSPGSVFAMNYFYVSANLNMFVGENNGFPSYHVSYNVTPIQSSIESYIKFYSSDGVSVGDLNQQTQDLTTGFDNSSGSQAADQLGGQVDDYLKQEDQLYDQMQYDVPEVDLQSDAQGILLASNFLQSLYVSDSFISRVMTFVLTFGLVLYIVGWLKK